MCTRFICAQTETPVSFSYFFSLGTRRNENLLPEVLTTGGYSGFQVTAGAYDPVTGMIGGFFWEGKFWQVFFGVVNLSREFLGVFKTIGRFGQFPRIPAA